MPTRQFQNWEIEGLLTLMKKNENDHEKEDVSPFHTSETLLPKHAINYFKPFFKPMPPKEPVSIYINIPLYGQHAGELARGNFKDIFTELHYF